MTVLATFSYGFIAFGPVAALFIVTVARHPHEVIVMMAGAFFWLLALFLSSLWWVMVPPLKDTPAFTLPFAVIFQEVFRWVFYRLLKKADKVLEVISDDKTHLRKHKIAYVGGMGFGVIAGVVAFSNVLRESGGPGIVGLREGTQFFVLASAFAANVVTVLHICWGVLWFDGWEKRDWIKVVIVFLSHMFISCLSLLNEVSEAYYLVTAHVLAFFLISYALYTAGARPRTLKYLFMR